MPITQSHFTGMDMDTSYSLRDQKKYYKLRNGSLTIDEGLGTGTVSNVNGNVYSFEIPASVPNPVLEEKPDLPASVSNQEIIGAGIVDDIIVLFSVDPVHVVTENPPPPPGGDTGGGFSLHNQPPSYKDRTIGVIWAFKYDDKTGEVIGIDTVTNPAKKLLDPTKHVIFYDRLDFKFNRPIKMIGSSESPTVKKAYFTDNWNNLRYINVMDLKVKEKPADSLELLDNVVFYQPTVRVVSGGLFMPGTVQYAFQMFTYGGGETVFSPATPLANISKELYTLSSTKSFTGTLYKEDAEVTDKACEISLDNFDDSFEYVRLVRIFYDTEYGTPKIDIIGEQQITSSGSFVFTDDGSITLGTLTKQEFASMGGVLFSSKDLATANNRLIAANIQETFYNPEYDARAYRFATLDSKIKSSTNVNNYISISTLGAWQEYGATSNRHGTDWDVPKDFDSVNVDKNVFYKQKDLATIGGSGKNISYVFDTQYLKIDSTVLKSETGVELDRNNASRKDEGTREHYGEGNKDYEWSTLLGNGFIDNTGYSNYASEVHSGQLLGYQRGETYRFGVVFYDHKGRKSFVYWIGDIKMPELYDSNGGNSFNITAAVLSSGKVKATYAKVLYPIFTIDNPPDDAVSYEIVRVPRGKNDKTIIASGLITPVARGMDGETWRPVASMLREKLAGYNNKNENKANEVGSANNEYKFVHLIASHGWASRFGATVPWMYNRQEDKNVSIHYSNHLFNFWSPEISFLKDIPLSGASLSVNGRIEKGYSAEFTSLYDGQEINLPFSLFYKGKYITPATKAARASIVIDDVKLISKETLNEEIPLETGDNYPYKHYYYQKYEFSETKAKDRGEDRFIEAQAGAGLIGYTTDSISSKIFSLIDGSGNYSILYGSIVNTDIIIYNGSSISARRSNRYIKASMLNNISDNVVNVFGGDTYITMFEHTRLYFTKQDRNLDWRWKNPRKDDTYAIKKSLQSVVVMPVETTVNVDWRTDLSYSKEGGNRELMKEFKGAHDSRGKIFDQGGDAYLVNHVYSKSNDTILSQEEPAFFEKLVTDLSHRLMASDAKYDGEVSDSWLKFKPNNILDIDGTNGEINAIQSISENLYFFQRKGIGVTKIDERALVNDTEGISLVLGTGDIFGKPQYISSTEGILSPFAIVRGRIGLYFYDHVNKVISAVGKNGILDVSRAKGVRSYIKNEAKKTLTYDDVDGVIAGFNPSLGMIYFTFTSNSFPKTGEDFTIGYDENLGEFVSFYDFIPRFYISDMERFITIQLSEAVDGWIHNIGPKGSFYGTIYDTILTTFISDQPSIAKVFDSIEYTHDADEEVSKPDTKPTPDQTFSEIRSYNNYFDSGLLSIDAKFRFRTWRAKIPRQNKHRAIGKYLKTDLHFDNGTNQPLFLQPLLTFWRPIAFIEP